MSNFKKYLLLYHAFRSILVIFTTRHVPCGTHFDKRIHPHTCMCIILSILGVIWFRHARFEGGSKSWLLTHVKQEHHQFNWRKTYHTKWFCSCSLNALEPPNSNYPALRDVSFKGLQPGTYLVWPSLSLNQIGSKMFVGEQLVA